MVDNMADEKPEAVETPAEKPQSREKELEERLMRLQAEFENYKKRALREHEIVKEKAAADAMLKILPVVDELEIAISHMDHAPQKEFKHGVQLIYAKLLDTLKKEGVEEIKAEGMRFDPAEHDAVRQAEGEDGKVIEVIQKGYWIKRKILRYAKVVVGKKDINKNEG